MGRPLNKKTLSLLRPTANVSVSSSELPANILRQKSSIGFIVQTADGKNLCTLTADDPQPGQMRLQAFAEDGSTYYVTDISKELITVTQGTGTQIPSGGETQWNLLSTDPNVLTVQNKTNWTWFNIYDTFIFNNQAISNDLSFLIYGSNGLDNAAVAKIAPDNTVVWSVYIDGALNGYVTGTFCGIRDYAGNSYVFPGDNDTDTMYIVKIDPRKEIIWQKGIIVPDCTNYNLIENATVDTENNLIIGKRTDDNHFLIWKFDQDGNLLWQKTTNVAEPTTEESWWSSIVVQSDNSMIIPLLQTVGGSPIGNIIRLNQDGEILWKSAFLNSDNPANSLWLTRTAITNNDAIISVGVSYDTKTTGLLQKFSPDGQLLWSRSYGKTGIDCQFYDLAVDADDNIYGLIQSDKMVLTKWSKDGDLIWSRYFEQTSLPAVEMWPWLLALVNDHLYINAYISDNSQGGLIRAPLDGNFIGSYTEPYPYTVTDAASEGYQVFSLNVAVTTSNVSVVSSNYGPFTTSALTLVDLPFGHNFGFGD